MRAVLLVLGVLLEAALFASDRSMIYGIVQDHPSSHVLAGADVQIQSESTGARWRLTADDAGHYFVAALPPGEYKVTVRLPGFRTVSKVGAVLEAEQKLRLDFSMELLSLHEAVTVVGGRDDLDPSGGDSLLVTRDGEGSTLPANGRDYRMLFDLLPGIVVTPAGANDGGQFTSNGQRPNAHAFLVDGVSANTGAGGSALPGSFPGASLPAMSAGGSTEELGSSGDTQSVELRTSSFAPEYGGRMGAQAQVVTRSGSNEFHGEVFGNARDSSWNARDWFANSYRLTYPRPKYGDVDGVLGGRIWRNRTFFFLSVEHSELHDSGIELTSVPSLAARQDAPAQLQGILSSFPLPIGPDLGGGEAEGLMGLGRATTVGTYSGRIDQTLGSWGALFVRYARSISASSSSQVEAIQGVSDGQSITIGITAGRSTGAIQEIRFNYSGANFFSRSTAAGSDDVWASLPNLPTPTWASSYPVLALSIPDLGQFLDGDYGMTARQDQWEFRDTVSVEIRRHQLRLGLDYIRLQPARSIALTSILGEAPSLQSLLQGDPLTVTISQLPEFGSRVQIGSLFAQDTFRVNENLNLVYGFRWELTPPAGAQVQIPTISGLWSGSDWITQHTGIDGTAPWPMRYGQFEPRIGLAYRLPGSGLVLRAGGGLFYDTTLGASINPINGAPFNSWLLAGGALTVSTAPAPPTGTETPPAQTTAPDVQQFLTGPYPALHLPMSYQWRASLEKGIAAHGTASVAYLGSSNRNLLGNETYTDPITAVLDRSTTLTENSSAYDALELQLRGSLKRNVYFSSSYTWSHCIDDGSQDSSVFLIHPGYQLSEARGSCNFDVRQALTSSVSYQVPRSTAHFHEWLSGWRISGIFRARNGFPINIVDNEQVFGEDVVNAARPDLVPGVPIWINDPTLAGHRRLNPAAFTIPAAGGQGTLGRNAIYGYGMTQVDVSLRRVFQWERGPSLEIGWNVFNVLNHPEFADPVPFLSNPLFGQSTSMQNLVLGSGTPNTGLAPLFQTGGSRSAEIMVRFSF
jgi:hypothetical protein